MADNFNISDQPGGGGAGVDSFEGRIGVVVAAAGDYLASEVDNDSGVAGADVATALDNAAASGPGATAFTGLTDTPAAYAGQSGHLVRVNNLATALEFASLVPVNRFGANDAVFVGAAAASGTARNGHSLIAFDDTTLEEISFEGIVGRWYNFNESLQIDIHWAAASAIVGAVLWQVEIENLAEGGQDLDSDGFAVGVNGAQTTDGTSGVLTYTGLSMTNAQADLIVAGNSFRLKVTRNAPNVLDTMVGDAQLLAVEMRMA